MRSSEKADENVLSGLKSRNQKGRPAFLHPWAAGPALAILICVIVFSIAMLGPFHAAELGGYDFLVVARGPAAPPKNSVVVDFDEASVRAYNAFPLPRDLLAEVLEKISAGAPKAIGLDVILDKPRTEVEDRRLAEALNRAGNVILASG
ncbi:MAG: CHASE2 domain-containing protein [Candidatus Acidiferrales bacterium]